MAVVLRTVGLRVLEVWIVGRADGHPVANRVAADDETAGMNARAAHRALQHLGILDGIAQGGVGTGLSVAQFRCTLNGIGQIHF